MKSLSLRLLAVTPIFTGCAQSIPDVTGPESISAAVSAVAPAAPDLLVMSGGRVKVMAADGSGAITVSPNTASYPRWGPGGSGTLANPYPFFYAAGSGCGTITRAGIYVNSLGKYAATTTASIPTSSAACRPAPSMDGLRIAFVPTGPGLFSNVSIIRVDGTGEQVIYTPASGSIVSNPVFSPDGGTIAFIEYIPTVSSSRSIRLTSLAGAATTLVAAGSFTDIVDLDWSLQNEILFQAGSQILGVSAAGGTPVPIVGSAQGPSASPAGTQVSYAGTGAVDLFTFDRGTGVSRRILKGSFGQTDWRK